MDQDIDNEEVTVQPSEITEVLNRPISQELLARDVTRLAYVAKDGTPRNVPIIFIWNGSQIVVCTSKNAPKLEALSENPMVALTIDTEVHPPKILLIRGRAEWISSMASRTSISRRPAATR
jgi:nitroimidazol reductase NimA-like FMN-containing flavoprotein (pyridoxamine 5'-phosphate oxidase superfamily)